MSKLLLSSNISEDIELNVLQFQSPLYQNISSVQTQSKQIHFPYKANQQQVSFLVQFSNERDYEAFQNFVRKHHLTMIGDTDKVKEVNFWWPEREFNNFTGFIKDLLAGGERFNPAPKASFTVELVDSFISRKTTISSFGSPYEMLYGRQIYSLRGALGGGVMRLPKMGTGLGSVGSPLAPGTPGGAGQAAGGIFGNTPRTYAGGGGRF